MNGHRGNAHPDLHRLIGETLAEIDRAGRPWTGWRRSLTDEQKKRLKDLEREIDQACLAGDRDGLVEALERHAVATVGDGKLDLGCSQGCRMQLAQLRSPESGNRSQGSEVSS